ncbi:MAG: hypothetical protein IPN68_06800 [Bacteroidetes bacterium]|nr:hypothetical protein [Bacteroidota bacterium]
MIHIAGKSNNIRRFLRLAWRMYHANNTSGNYHRYVKRVAKDTISLSHALNDNTIPVRIFKKINWYMVESLIMGEMLARLAGKQVTDRDRQTLVYLGAIMALFDVFIDDFRFDRVRVLDILDYTFSTDRPIKTVSDSQFGSDITEESILSITNGKGGVSAMICSAFLGQKDESFRKAVFETGGFIQMMNDCQDIHKDTVSGIRTFVHFCNNFTEIFTRMNEQRLQAFRALMLLDLPPERKSATLFELNAMFVVISYKLHVYSRACNYTLNYPAIREMDRKLFRINPFSLRAIISCVGPILEFDSTDLEAVPDFKFEQS